MKYDNDSLPTFYHGREPQVMHQVRRHNYKTAISPRKPLTQQTLNSIFHSIRKNKSKRPPIFQKINLNKSIKNFVSNSRNLEDSLVYNQIELNQPDEKVSVLLIDSSYSMGNYSSTVKKLSKKITCDLILYHDTDLFNYQLIEYKPTQCIGGTNYYRSIKRLLDTTKNLHITHLTDGETTFRDKEHTNQLIQQDNRDGIYKLIKVQTINL